MRIERATAGFSCSNWPSNPPDYCRCLAQREVARRSRKACTVYAVATQTKTVKIGTRGSPLALAQAYLTRDLLKVCSMLTVMVLALADDHQLCKQHNGNSPNSSIIAVRYENWLNQPCSSTLPGCMRTAADRILPTSHRRVMISKDRALHLV